MTMKTSLESSNGLKRLLTVELPIADFKQKTDKILQKLAKDIKVDGFRKGRVPMNILHQRFGANARSDATNELIQETLFKALKENKLEAAAQPSVKKVNTEDADNFSYTVELEVFPEIELVDFAKLKIEKVDVKITKKDEDLTLQGLKQQQIEYKKVKRKSKNGDKLTIDFKGKIDGKLFQGGEAKDFDIILGSKSMIKGFEEGLIGVEIDKDTSLDLTFPKDYHVKELSAKDVVFDISVKNISEPKLPELDEEFAKKFGEKNMDDLLKSMKKQMQKETGDRIDKINKDATFDALLEAHKFEVPHASVDNEAKALLDEMQNRLKQQNMPTSGDLTTTMFNDEATKRVKLGLLVSKIAGENKLTATSEEINKKIEQIAKSYGEDVKQMTDYYNQDKARLASIESLVVEQKVVDIVAKDAKTTIKNKKFIEVTQQR